MTSTSIEQNKGGYRWSKDEMLTMAELRRWIPGTYRRERKTLWEKQGIYDQRVKLPIENLQFHRPYSSLKMMRV